MHFTILRRRIVISRAIAQISTIVVAATAAIAHGESPAPFIRFQKTGKALLDVGPKGAFDSCQAKYPAVLKVGDEWWMWYNGRTDDCFTGSIGLAKSRDGQKWIKHNGGRPIFEHGPEGAFDSTKVDHPAVLHFGGKYHMWYTAGAARDPYTIGYATSDDGIAWRRENDARPVLTVGEKGKFDDENVLHPTVVRDDEETLHLWYNGVGPQKTFRLGYATSRDGIAWKRQNGGDPVVTPSTVGPFVEAYVYNAHVRIDDGLFHMWYSAFREPLERPNANAIIHATSRDGIHWKKDSAPTLVNGPSGSQDDYACFACCIVPRERGFWMYYSMADFENKTYRVGLARQVK